MLRYFLILLLLSSFHLYAQDDEIKTEAEKTADSILNQFKNSDEKNFEAESKEEQEKLIAAEEKYMDEFLKLERDEASSKKFKTYLQLFIGLVFLFIFIIVIKNGRKKNIAGL